MLKYFAYGSNMSLSRLRERAASAQLLGSCILRAHDLRFHKVSRDRSAKCDAFYTENPEDYILGVLFEMRSSDKKYLDAAEGLGHGYDEKYVIVEDDDGNEITAITYYALVIDAAIKPYSWYKNHVLIGAKESSLPESYIQKIEAVECIEDPDRERDTEQRDIHR
jgi:hypothetical protein